MNGVNVICNSVDRAIQGTDVALEQQCYFSAVPVELLVHIFECAAYDDPDAPLRIGGVQQHWRNVVRGSTSLWTSLHLGKHNPEGKAELWLLMSQSHVHELVVHSSAGCAVYNELRLAGHLPHLRLLKLDVLDLGAKYDYMTNPQSSSYLYTLNGLPELQQFHVRAPDGLIGVSEHSADALTRLLHLRLESAYVHFHKPHPTPVLRTLHLVSFQSLLSVPYLATVLKQSTSLRALYMQDIHAIHIYGGTPPAVQIELPELTSLELRGAITISPLMGALVVPSLERLVVTFHVPSLFLLQRLRPSDLSNIRELRLRNVSAEPRLLVPYISSMSRLAVLELSGCNEENIDAALEELARARVPLREVDFSGCSCLSGQPLVRLVEATSGLYSMRLGGNTRIEANHRLWLESHVPQFRYLQ